MRKYFEDRRIAKIADRERTLQRIWAIGGKRGWYYGNWMWRLRGYMDELAGGPGLRRGRRHPLDLQPGDYLDVWRVAVADREAGRLLLVAEMKLPGEAWLEFKIAGEELVQTASFRARGLAGKLYWYSMLPFHGFIFPGMIRQLI
ncbi:DUF2867 domain-containing protein [Chitinophaga oryzae]|uniref:DUF2867 domain-containing protein n=1 Tax=Chitinophaga oryzae TaxID=2725414 RepID=A0AAE7D5L0_9BACT|nr:DUF2867 domain-containing protein [Chitinophaga oryzae]QJB30315.1 DUF2867 domain-containing protein [Chitinophaga oryzae]QJB36824.1 DUF2867 domain-containing protein [Chitinophaga oryzae]